MKIEQKYSHLNGLEWIMVHQAEAWPQTKKVIHAINVEQWRTKVSQTRAGKFLYSPTA
jgi:hypothetical protein